LTTRPAPNRAAKAPASRPVSGWVLTTAGVRSLRTVTTGMRSSGIPAAMASPFAADPVEQELSHRDRVAAHRELQLHLVGDDVVLRAAEEAPDRHDARLQRIDLARDERLQRRHDARTEHDRIPVSAPSRVRPFALLA
jgi:hypothetical protein